MATKKDATITTTTGMRRCIGSAMFGIEAHEAPVDDFPVQASGKDGLGRMCRAHWTEYTRALRKAALARKAEAGETPELPAREALVGSKKAKAPTRAQRRAAAPMAHRGKPESTRVRNAKAVVAATETLAGEAYTDAIGSDEVQSALEVIANGHGVETQETPLGATIDSSTEDADVAQEPAIA